MSIIVRNPALVRKDHKYRRSPFSQRSKDMLPSS